MSDKQTLLFEAHVAADCLPQGDPYRRCETWRNHLTRLGKEKDAVFSVEGGSLCTRFPSGLLIQDNRDHVIFFSTKKDLDEEKAKSEIGIMANYLMRRGWKAYRNTLTINSSTTQTQFGDTFFKAAKEACTHIDREIIASLLNDRGQSVA